MTSELAIIRRPLGLRSLSLENPSTPLSAPSDWLFETLSGGFGIDGQLHVNEHTAMQLNTVRACVRAISEDTGTAPLDLYRKTANGVKLADDRNEYWLLHRQPNPHMTACIFRETMTVNALLWGNAYAEIEYNGAGKITALWPLYPAFTRMEILPNRRLRYITSDPITGQQRVILNEDMLHIKGTSLDGYQGLMTIRHHRVPIGLALALENYALHYFMNGSKPGGVLEVPGTLSPEAQARIAQSWSQMHSGPKNSNKIAILEQNMKFSAISIANTDAQFNETRKMQADEIARMFRMPPHKIGILERSTNNNIEHQGLEYVTDCLRPWFQRWESELNIKMFPSSREYLFDHDEDGLARGDFATRMEGYAKGRQWGWLSVNTILRKENMNTIGPDGDHYITPLNMVDAKDINKIAPAPEPSFTPSAEPKPVEPKVKPKRDISFLQPMFADAVRRALRADRNKQVQKYVSQTFYPVILSIALANETENAEGRARTYADSLHTRLQEWDSNTAENIIAEEFTLAQQAMKEPE